MCFDQSSNCSPSKGPSSVYFSGGDDDSTTPLAWPGEVRLDPAWVILMTVNDPESRPLSHLAQIHVSRVSCGRPGAESLSPCL